MCPVSRVNSSFSRVNSRKRRVKGAAGHSLRHTLLKLAFRILSASVNMLLEALRGQQQLRKGCFAVKLFIFEGLEPQKTRETRSLLHNLITLASMVRTATLNMQLGALRDQQQLWENCSLKNVRAQEALERCKPPKTAQTAKSDSPESSPGV